MVSGAKSGANFSLKAYFNLVKRVEVVILLPKLFLFLIPIIFFSFCCIKLFFRIVAFLEGVSYILLMTIGLYFKYQLNDASYVKLLGMPHGLLFVLYIIIAYLLREDENWDIKDFRIVLLASVIPFGTFYIDRKYFKK